MLIIGNQPFTPRSYGLENISCHDTKCLNNMGLCVYYGSDYKINKVIFSCKHIRSPEMLIEIAEFTYAYLKREGKQACSK